jgi:transcription initiation factor TFIIIB Brf1 subunit/transcription initiation factor TFIIB
MDHFQVTAMSAADVRMHDINKSIEAICDAFRIQYRSILYYTAIDLSQKLEEKVRICGRKRKASYAAAFYFACKIHNAFRELRTIADVCGFDLKDLNYGVRMFNEHLADVVSVREESPHENLVYSSILELSIDDAKKRSLRVSILDVMKKHSDLFYGGRKPRTIAAALILLLGVKHGAGLTAVDVSKNLKISHAALMTCARELSTTYNIAF